MICCRAVDYKSAACALDYCAAILSCLGKASVGCQFYTEDPST